MKKEQTKNKKLKKEKKPTSEDLLPSLLLDHRRRYHHHERYIILFLVSNFRYAFEMWTKQNISDASLLLPCHPSPLFPCPGEGEGKWAQCGEGAAHHSCVFGKRSNALIC